MAPLEQYLMTDRNAEISLARSAAPESIAANAEVLVLTSHGFESAVKGTNGFVCIVERSWATGTEDPDFWSPKLRAPICYNAPGARSELAITFKKTEWVLAGRSKEQISEALQAAFEKKQLAPPEPGAMCYMLSKQGHLNDRDGHWHPHLMFFVPQSEPAAWGAGLSGSPILSFDDPQEHQAAMVIKVGQWSDGTVDQEEAHGTK